MWNVFSFHSQETKAGNGSILLHQAVFLLHFGFLYTKKYITRFISQKCIPDLCVSFSDLTEPISVHYIRINLGFLAILSPVFFNISPNDVLFSTYPTSVLISVPLGFKWEVEKILEMTFPKSYEQN